MCAKLKFSWICACLAVGLILGGGCVRPSKAKKSSANAADVEPAPEAPSGPEIAEDSQETPVPDKPSPEAEVETEDETEDETSFGLVLQDVYFKAGRTYENELSIALGIPLSELCFEFETESCFDIHKVALLGVDAFDAAIFAPFEETQTATVAAVDRFSLLACGERVRRDLDDGDGLIFSNLAIVDGRLADTADPAITKSLQTLYKRLLQRLPSADEESELLSLYQEAVVSGSTQPAKDWAQLSCFVVTSMVEFLFY